jgi:hypothetical protein
MSLSSAAVAHEPTLADVVGETLAAAFEAEHVNCLWCGATASRLIADRFTGRVVVRCPDCGAELEGVRARRPGEAR